MYRMADSTNYFYADTDLTNQYLWSTANRTYDLGVVGHVEREMIWIHPLSTLVVLDRILTTNQTKLSKNQVGGLLTASQVVTTFLNHCETNPTIVSNTSLCDESGQDAMQTVLEPTSPTLWVINRRDAQAAAVHPMQDSTASTWTIQVRRHATTWT